MSGNTSNSLVLKRRVTHKAMIVGYRPCRYLLNVSVGSAVQPLDSRFTTPICFTVCTYSRCACAIMFVLDTARRCATSSQSAMFAAELGGFITSRCTVWCHARRPTVKEGGALCGALLRPFDRIR